MKLHYKQNQLNYFNKRIALIIVIWINFVKAEYKEWEAKLPQIKKYPFHFLKDAPCDLE